LEYIAKVYSGSAIPASDLAVDDGEHDAVTEVNGNGKGRQSI
jgi:hypothetical protein